jgi:hypothetical protein
MPAIRRQGMSGRLSVVPAESRLTASPMISSCRITASCQWGLGHEFVVADRDVALDLLDGVEHVPQI